MPSTYRPKPSLNECGARIVRADEHIERLEKELAALVLRQRTRWTRHDPGGQLIISSDQIPTIVTILIGETFYNLRTALDYLAAQLYYLATGTFHGSTKFIIEDTSSAWQRHFTSKHPWITSLSGKHQTMLEGLQPFKGHAWLKTFRTFSNTDKHRHFLVIVRSQIIRVPLVMMRDVTQ